MKKSKSILLGIYAAVLVMRGSFGLSGRIWNTKKGEVPYALSRETH